MENENQRPWSEIWKEAADEWVDLEAAARLLEETKSAVLAQREAACGDIPVNRATQLVKSSLEWMDHLEKVVDAKTASNKSWVKVEFYKMKYNEWVSQQANERTMARL